MHSETVFRPMADDFLQQLQQIQAERQVAYKKRYRRSRLDRYRAEILTLEEAGASHRDICMWLIRYKRVKVHFATVSRALKRWHQRES